MIIYCFACYFSRFEIFHHRFFLITALCYLKTKSSHIFLSKPGVYPLTIPSDVNSIAIEISGACRQEKLNSFIKQHRNGEIVRTEIPIISSEEYEVFIGGEFDFKAAQNSSDLSSGIRLASNRASPIAIAYERRSLSCDSSCPSQLNISMSQCLYGYVLIYFSNARFDSSGIGTASLTYNRRRHLLASMQPSNFPTMAPSSGNPSIKIYRYFVVSSGFVPRLTHLAGFYNEHYENVFVVDTSYNLVKINPSTGAIFFTKTYNIYRNQSIDSLLIDLNSSNSSVLIVLFTYDEPQANRLYLSSAVYRCGGTKAIFGNSSFVQWRGAYMLIGFCGQSSIPSKEYHAGKNVITVLLDCKGNSNKFFASFSGF